MEKNVKNINYSLGYNFDRKLLDTIINLNSKNNNKIIEFYGALKDSPISSARPTKRIPSITWKEFESQIKLMINSNISFNFLMNTFQHINKEMELKLKKYLDKLFSVGISKITVGNPTMCNVFKNIDDRFEITISSIYGAKTEKQLFEAEKNGADEIYLDGLFVNRNIRLLEKLIEYSSIKIKLYANISCLSQCPLKDEHYSTFFGNQNENTINKNDKYFEWCSKIKLQNPVHWLQMPWIRPEDISYYNSLGIHSFKLSDRLAPTNTLKLIAEHYLIEKSPDNLFRLIERDGAKYHRFVSFNNGQYPIYVDSSKIPEDFINHFIEDNCNSNDITCDYCNNIAEIAIKYQTNKRIKNIKKYEITENYLY